MNLMFIKESDHLKNKLWHFVRYILVVLIIASICALSLFILAKGHSHRNFSLKTETKTSSSHFKNIQLTAIGDSLTYGQQDPTSKGGYVYLIQQKLQKQYHIKVTTYNFGKSGDRTSQIKQRIIQNKNIQEKLSEANVITMTFGGNDLVKVVQDHPQAFLDNNLTQIMPQEEKQYIMQVRALLDTVRQYNPAAPVFVISIYNPFYVYFPTLEILQHYTDQWVKITQDVVQSYSQMYFVNVNQRLSQGQYLGKNQAQLKKENQLDLTNLTPAKIERLLNNSSVNNSYLSSTDHFHPNLKGYKYIATKLDEVMSAHRKTWLVPVN